MSQLLDSILSQSHGNFDVVIAEDGSPERPLIADVAREYERRYPGRIHYYENPVNLGYDGNLRRLVELADGDYVLFMGNDDLMAPNALQTISDVLARHSNVGVVLRAYAAFEGDPSNIVQEFKYFDRELFFPAGAQTIGTVYRRSVVIPGMVLHRKAALAHATCRFDGTLLYQLYLVAELLVTMNAVYLPQVIALYRNGGTPDFGNSEAEKGKFQPKAQTPESSLHFIRGMLEIASFVATERQVPIYEPILKDMANYAYPLLSIQARLSKWQFMRYAKSLSTMGLGRYPLFWIYFLAILVLGAHNMDVIIGTIKKRLGRTPAIGGVYRGEPQ
ncbi:MAG: glycosyltransferase family 2 protein [Aquabacterium sp.]|nr:glycosyltransferase family 2 protein [Aquabacterium sp.]